MGYAHNVLFDDRTVVENFSYVVTGCTDQFDAAGECSVIGPGADERRQERMVNVDDPLRKGIDELGGKNLHVAGKHNQVHRIFFKQRNNLTFSGELVFLVDRHQEKWDAVELCDSSAFRVVRD